MKAWDPDHPPGRRASLSVHQPLGEGVSNNKLEEARMTDSTKSHGASDAAMEMEKLRADIATLRDDVARLVKTLASEAKGLASEAKGDASEEVRRLYAKLSEQSGRSARAIAHEVEERPLMALLLAFGIGFIGGTLLRR